LIEDYLEYLVEKIKDLVLELRKMIHNHGMNAGGTESRRVIIEQTFVLGS
jgi:hypothetical protein